MGKITVSMFSRQDKKILQANQFTLYVTDCRIYFTDEFKDLFVEKFKQGLKPREIFQSCGYDPMLLGSSRIADFAQRAKKHKHPMEPHVETAMALPITEKEMKLQQPNVLFEMLQNELVYMGKQLEILRTVL